MRHEEKVSYLEEITWRYHAAGRQEKGKILDEFCLICHYHRKYAIQLLNKGSVPVRQKPRGRKPIYDKEAILPHLRAIWLATDMMCGKRLKQAMPLWLPYYSSSENPLPQAIKTALLNMSPASIDRMLKDEKNIGRLRGLSGTRPGYLLKTQIPIKTDNWDVTQPGFMEADTVAHCGSSLSGEFAWSITLVDIHTGWTEIRASWGKGAEGDQGIVSGIREMENKIPFVLKGFDCDNGCEFLNYHLLRYFQEREKPVKFTRSRPYKKNDNAHVEQKNWTGVRHVFGYYRIDKQHLVELMNDIYRHEWRLLMNFYYPSAKLVEKTKINSKYKRKHDKPKTPLERLLSCKSVSEATKKALRNQLEALNPFDLKSSLERKLKRVFEQLELQSNPKRRI